MLRILSRVCFLGAALSLAGCSGTMDLFKSQGESKPAIETADAPSGGTAAVETAELAKPAADGTEAMAADLPVQRAVVETRTEATVVPTSGIAAAVEWPGGKPIIPQDDVSLGKKYYIARDYGLAEKHFRAAAESHPRNAEAWLGLAASYDELRRFDLADRAYTQAIKLAGEQVAIINNQGYSYILRGDYKRARERLMLADVKSPDNPYVKANLLLLAKRSGRTAAIQ